MDRKIQVLIVEDNLATCSLLRAFIEQAEGLELCGEAHNGREGLELLQDRQVDLILLDLIMPGVDGISFLSALQEQGVNHGAKVVVLSGVGSDEFVQRAIRLGASYYIIKPIHLEELALRINELFPTPEGSPEKVIRLLHSLGANPDCHGFHMAGRAAILLNGRDARVQLKEIYIHLATEFNTTWSCVERNLRTTVRQVHAAETDLYRTGMGFAGKHKPPDNGAFLRALAKLI